MFARAELEVPLSFSDAEPRLAATLARRELADASRTASVEGLRFVMPIGPRGDAWPTRDVVVRVLPARGSDRSVTFPVRWEVPGPSGWLYPELDAELSLVAVDEQRSKLEIVGRYEPPLGPLGKLADRVALTRVAAATLDAFLRELGTHVVEHLVA